METYGERKKIALLGQLLVYLGRISLEQLRSALALQKEKYSNKRIGEILVDLGYITEEKLKEALSLQYLYPYLDLQRYRLNKEIVKLIPKEVVLKHKLIALDRFGDILTVGMAEPLNKEAVKEVEEITNLEVRVFAVSKVDLEQTLNLILPLYESQK